MQTNSLQTLENFRPAFWLRLLALLCAVCTLSLGLLACGGGGGSDDFAGAINRKPTASNITYGTPVGNSSSVSLNWKTLSAAADADGDSLSGIFTYSGGTTTVYTGPTTAGTFSVVGDTITYTTKPNSEAATETAPFRISDGKGGSVDVTVSVTGVDTKGPVLTQTGAQVVSPQLGYQFDLTSNETMASWSQVTTYFDTTSSTFVALTGGASVVFGPAFTSGTSTSLRYNLIRSAGHLGSYRAVLTVTDAVGNSSVYTANFIVN